MKEFLINYAWCIWIGISFGLILRIDVNSWKWWITVIPLIILVSISKYMGSK